MNYTFTFQKSNFGPDPGVPLNTGQREPLGIPADGGVESHGGVSRARHRASVR